MNKQLKDRYFYNNLGFRIAAPPLFGVLFYMLILMFFDSINMLVENFFSREVLFTVLLTYLFFEGNRLNIVLNNKFFPLGQSFKLRIVIQFLVSIILTLTIISITLYYYFVYIEGFSTITTELLTFNSIYTITSVFYNLFFFSLVFLTKKNESKIEFEKRKNENLNLELISFKNQINPGFLFQALEIVIIELHKNKKAADNIVDKLAKVYRYTLDNKNNELISAMQDIESLNIFAQVFRYKHKQNLKISISKIDSVDDRFIIPGTLQLLLEYALSENLISDSLPLSFNVSANDTHIIVQYPLHTKLSLSQDNTRLQLLEKAYEFYTPHNNKIDFISDRGSCRTVFIPLIVVEDE